MNMPNRKGQGRKPVPTELKKLRGTVNVTREKARKAEPKVDTKRPRRPTWLDKRAKAEWKRLCDILEGMAILSTAYAPALEAICDAYSKWRQSEEMVAKMGHAIVTRNSKGEVEVRRNPFTVEMHKHKDAYVRLLSEFGLTPSTKTRVSTEKDNEGSATAFERFRATRSNAN